MAIEKQGKPIRFNLLKARQTGATSLISAYTFYRMCAEPDTLVAVMLGDNGGQSYNIYQIYKTFLEGTGLEFTYVENENCLKMDNGSEVQFGTHFEGHPGKGRCIPHRLPDCDIVYIPEAGHYKAFEYLTSQFTFYDQTVLIEASGCQRDSFYYDFWFGNSTSVAPDYPSFFMPWFVSNGNRINFKSDKERYAFEDTMNDELKKIGAGFTMPKPGIGYCVYIDKHEAWLPRWQSVINFWDWEISTENVLYYIQKSKEYNGCLKTFRKDYPTFSDEAFI